MLSPAQQRLVARSDSKNFDALLKALATGHMPGTTSNPHPGQPSLPSIEPEPKQRENNGVWSHVPDVKWRCGWLLY